MAGLSVTAHPGLIKAITELWPEADRQRCTVHRLRNIIAKLPKRAELHERIKGAYWAALDEATDPEDAERRLRELVTTWSDEYPSAAACLAEDLPALCVHLKYFPRLRKRFRSSNLLERSLEEVAAEDQGNRTVSWRNELPQLMLGGARRLHCRRAWTGTE